jgi:hypothetical protein
MDMGEILVGVLFILSIYFAWWCGTVDCSVDKERNKRDD